MNFQLPHLESDCVGLGCPFHTSASSMGIGLSRVSSIGSSGSSSSSGVETSGGGSILVLVPFLLLLLYFVYCALKPPVMFVAVHGGEVVHNATVDLNREGNDRELHRVLDRIKTSQAAER